ncbi:MAG TPA: hypothetical protein VF665_01235 [Longimicrobium sp.]|jgi:hypothetical protein|uniref:hypothetical protein n=1 Tax=Longimicrobium sp. TaxID=2029185 RepID=UPI002ED93024
MAMREFSDARGVQWQVWDVQPTLRVAGGEQPGSLLHEDAAEGWLTFQSASERRRFYQRPPDWESLSDEQLARLCNHAVPVATTRP